MRACAVILSAALVCAVGCADRSEAERKLKGWGALEFGMSLDEALATAPSVFSPYSLAKCRETGALYGCSLQPTDDYSVAVTREGIPYALRIATNSHGRLTDITLQYRRRISAGEGTRISRSECVGIYDRTLDWLEGEYGDLSQPSPRMTGNQVRQSSTGREYRYSEKDGAFMSRHAAEFLNARSVNAMIVFLDVGGGPSCTVSIDFKDDPAIPRWELSPEDRAMYEKIVD